MKKLDELKLKDKRIIIFDLDGTLVDSIGVWNMTDQKLVYDYSGIHVDLECIQADRDCFLNNHPSSDIYISYCEFLIKKYGLKIENPYELSNIRKNIANEVLKCEMRFKPSVTNLIIRLKDLGYILVLASTTTSEQLEIYYKENQKMLEEMNIKDVFDFIVTKESAKNQKPDPEIYFTTMDYFDAKPNECLIFEDSYTGVMAATRAGIEVVNIYDKYSDGDRDKINAITDYSITNYDEFISYFLK